MRTGISRGASLLRYASDLISGGASSAFGGTDLRWLLAFLLAASIANAARAGEPADDGTTPARSVPSASSFASSTPQPRDVKIQPAGKINFKPGQAISVGMEAEDIIFTDDLDLARRQTIAYPDSAEASFILAVAMTRTSRVEEALKEVRRARRLAQAKGGASYFDSIIQQYEKMLDSYPDDNRVRYGLAWAYYMKAYLLAKSAKSPTYAAFNATSQDAKNLPAADAGNTAASAVTKAKTVDAGDAAKVLGALNPKLAEKFNSQTGSVPTTALPHIKGALENSDPANRPQIKQYYEQAIKNLDELLQRNPGDVWARVYRAHLNAEYTGDLTSSMAVWSKCKEQSPNNPAPYFFLGEGYLKQGNLKECLHNISRAIALRAIGN